MKPRRDNARARSTSGGPVGGFARGAAGAVRPMRIVSRRYHLHVPGLVYVATTIMLAFGAINSQNNLLFWAFGVAVAGLLVSGFLSGASLMGLEMVRDGVDDVSVGRVASARYRVHNRNRFLPAMALVIEELDADHAGSGLLRGPVGSVEHVAARAWATAESRAVARRRGAGKLSRVRVWTTYPFGLTRKSVLFEEDARFHVLPRVMPLRDGAVRGLTRGPQRGSRTTAAVGISDEFRSLREYREGDGPRGIAWRPSARTGQLVVRQTASPTPLRLWIELTPTHLDLEDSIALAAGLASQAIGEGWSVGLSASGLGVTMVPAAGSRHLGAMLRALASAELREHAGAAAAPRGADSVIRIGGVAGAVGVRAAHLTAADIPGLLRAGEVWPPKDEMGERAEGVGQRVARWLGLGSGGES